MNTSPSHTSGDYANRLFNNVYNYVFLGATLVSTMASDDPWLFWGGMSIEAAMLLIAPNLNFVRQALEPGLLVRAKKVEDKARAKAMQMLPGQPRQRCQTLLNKQRQIVRLAQENPRFEAALLGTELEKLERLARSFVDLSLASQRFSDHLRHEDIEAIRGQADSYLREVAQGSEQAKDVAKKNYDILSQRLARLGEIQSFLSDAAGQLSLIENAVNLLADEIVAMHSPGQMSAELDSVIDGVDAVRQTARMVDQMMVKG